jgi:predicted acylesterase/phospholipase RssA
MKPADDTVSSATPAAHDTEVSLLIGSGGSRAILAGAGAILACHLADLNKFKHIGGASGGSIPTALLAAGFHPIKLAHLAVKTNFSDLITRHASLLKVIVTYFLKDNFYLLVRPRKGLFSSYLLGKFIDEHCPAWPENFWTVAADGSSQFVFTKDGVFEYKLNGTRRQLAKVPPPVGLAVRATAAIPGVFDAVKYRGHYLFDGALSIDGRTPVGPLTRHMGAKHERLICVDIGEGTVERPVVMFFLWKVFWRIICGKHCPVEGKTPLNSDGTILVRPEIKEFDALEFTLDPDRKWAGLMAGFVATCYSLRDAGMLTGEKLEKALTIAKAYEEIKRTAIKPGERADRTEALLASHGLY